MKRMKWVSALAVVVGALALAACASEDDERDAMGSQLQQPPAGTRRPPPIEAGDVAIVGQDVARDLVQLAPISEATVPPLVRFNGVTSIIVPPIDTAPYTVLLRDRLLLLTRAKLRFVEHTLPPYIPGGKHKHAASTAPSDANAQYQVLAELRGKADADKYKIQVEFVDLHSGDILYNETFRIGKEAGAEPDASQYNSPMAPPTSNAPPPSSSSATGAPQPPPPGYYDPAPATNTPSANSPSNNGVL